ncbi:MAG: accessory factor UbiK family protein [Methyloligellaceae bacterium]
MTQTNNRFFDELAKLMTDAAGAASGVRNEFETILRSQGERILREMDLVQREEFEAVKEMSRKSREENARLQARLDEMEEHIQAVEAELVVLRKPRPVRKP